ncbi:MAG: adenylyltransferase/cytidyltransferase family protein [Planctomycetes bacterium]|nr:adenylyltransferase/cytidyltransferase family protein [Planctomycetota bacterium]
MVSSLDELKDIVFCLQSENKTVVLANGTFDLLHVGHMRLLKDAKTRGDYLVVAVNSDASVKTYKNPKLPIVSESERLEMISGLRWVDYVVMFDESTCDALLEMIRPDVVAKGTDYTETDVPELETIQKIGATVAICGDPKDHGSSKLIQRIRRLKLTKK